MEIQSSRNEGTRACGVRVLRVQIFMYNVHCRLQLKKIADFFLSLEPVPSYFVCKCSKI